MYCIDLRLIGSGRLVAMFGSMVDGGCLKSNLVENVKQQGGQSGVGEKS